MRTGARACVTGGGLLFRVHLKPHPPQNYREAFATPEEAKQLQVLLDHFFDEGFMLINTCSGTISTAMTEAAIDSLVEAMESGLAKIESSTPRSRAASPRPSSDRGAGEEPR